MKHICSPEKAKPQQQMREHSRHQLWSCASQWDLPCNGIGKRNSTCGGTDWPATKQRWTPPPCCLKSPTSENSANEWVDTDTTLPDAEQAQTFDLTLPAARAGLLLSLSKNNLYSTWKTKWLIKWKQTSLSSSEGYNFEWCICIFNEAEMLGPGTSDT